MDCDGFEQFKTRIHTKIGLDLSKYKEKQLKRRIMQFMNKHNTKIFDEFFVLLNTDQALLTQFKKFITINTSEFFRDSAVFEYLSNTLIPSLAKEKQSIKIWSSGCSIGAEPYSLAILCQEARMKSYNIIASDYDIHALEKAKEGNYSANQLKNVPKNLIDGYFDLHGEQYAVNHILKANINFVEHNMLNDNFQKGYDLILCRNVFIYFNQVVQLELITKYINSLNPNGYFIIGSSEFIPTPKDFGLSKVCSCIYQKS